MTKDGNFFLEISRCGHVRPVADFSRKLQTTCSYLHGSRPGGWKIDFCEILYQKKVWNGILGVTCIAGCSESDSSVVALECRTKLPNDVSVAHKHRGR